MDSLTSTGAVQATRICLDCGGELLPRQKFCPECGQRTSLSRLTLHEIVHEFLHSLVHADRSVYALLRSLLLRPGTVAREYVLGRRRRYFGPFATLAVLIGVSTVLSELLGFESITSSAPLNAVQNFLNQHVDLVVFVEVPLLSVACVGLFRADGYTFAEHTVLVAYAFCLRVLLFLVLLLPYWYLFRSNPASIGYAVAITWSAYFGFAASQFYSGNRLLCALKGAALAALLFPLQSQIITAIAVGYNMLQLL